MEFRNLLYLSTLLLSLAAVCIGSDSRQADLLIPGIISVALSTIMLIESFRGRVLKMWVPMILNAFLILSLLSTILTDFTDFIQLTVATPLFVALGACILFCLIAYTDIRLDRVMFYVYFLFLTLAVSNTFSYGVYYYYLRYGVTDEMLANFWLVDEFAFALTFCIIAMLVMRMYLRKKNIRLITAEDFLERYDDKD